MLGMICCLAVVSGCGGSGASHQVTFPNQGPGVGTSIRTADCSDWKRGNVEQRRRTVAQLRDFSGGAVGSSSLKHGPVLDDQRAYSLLERYCAPYLSRGFKLYKLYDRAASFVGRVTR